METPHRPCAVLVIIAALALLGPPSATASGGTAGSNCTWHWPVPGTPYLLNQDYAHFDSGGTAPDDEYHTGIDIQAAMGTTILAAADGVIVARCDPTDGYESGCPTNDKGDNHNLDGTVMIAHNCHGSSWIFTMYSHLFEVDSTLEAGEAVVAGQPLGSTDEGNHLHFEVKSRGVLHNPICPAFICGTDTRNPKIECTDSAECHWGYTPGDTTDDPELFGHPNEFGYHDPIRVLHKANQRSPALVEITADDVQVRMGPDTGYRAITEAFTGDVFLRVGFVPGATAGCDRGWVMVEPEDGGRFIATKDTGEVPDGWICRDFVSLLP